MTQKEILKKNLGYVIRNKRGKIKDLIEYVGERMYGDFIFINFIELGDGKWEKTWFADDYYTAQFGYLSFWYEKTEKGKIIMKKFKRVLQVIIKGANMIPTGMIPMD